MPMGCTLGKLKSRVFHIGEACKTQFIALQSNEIAGFNNLLSAALVPEELVLMRIFYQLQIPMTLNLSYNE